MIVGITRKLVLLLSRLAIAKFVGHKLCVRRNYHLFLLGEFFISQSFEFVLLCCHKLVWPISVVATKFLVSRNLDVVPTTH